MHAAERQGRSVIMIQRGTDKRMGWDGMARLKRVAVGYWYWYWAENDMSTSRPMCFPFWKKYEDIDQEAGRAGEREQMQQSSFSSSERNS